MICYRNLSTENIVWSFFEVHTKTLEIYTEQSLEAMGKIVTENGIYMYAEKQGKTIVINFYTLAVFG